MEDWGSKSHPTEEEIGGDGRMEEMEDWDRLGNRSNPTNLFQEVYDLKV